MNVQTAVSQIKRTYTAKGRQQSGFYSIEGVRLHERALRAGASLALVLISERVANKPSDRERLLCSQLAATNIPLTVIADNEMMRLTNGRSLGDLIGLLPIPAPTPLADLIENVASPLLVTAVEIIDPGNVGAMIRTAHGLGCAAMIRGPSETRIM